MQKLLIATHNPAKFNDICRFLSDIPYELVSLNDRGITEDVEEDQPTFELNAIKKAKFFAEKSGLPTLGDDSGMEIDCLGGKPGVFSKRWAGDESDGSIISHTLQQLKGVPAEKRGAQFRVVIAYAKPDGSVITAEGVTRGIIADKPYSGKITKSFPYNQLLFLPELNKYYHDDELTKEELLRYNHRKIALAKLKKYLT
ncbi:MAG: non-canonical purine NTP pyrophosphatase [Candidatus Roizmanbacteria bacterium]|nr:non-canonical purine NTP pyrophosphatase [Candidatus Roizmanbacteria bacterium]